MTANKINSDLFLAESEVPDPGSAGTIKFNKSLATCRLVSAGAEARTMADPTRGGAIAILAFYTDGGDVTVTFSTAYTEDGATTFVFSDVGQWAIFLSILVSPAVYAWRKVADYTLGDLSITELAALNGVTAGTAAASKAVILDSASSVKGLNTVGANNLSVADNGTLTMGNMTNLALGTGSGTRIGTAANQKLGLFGVTPIVKPAGTGELVGMAGNGATNANAVNMTANGNSGSTAYSLNDVVKAMKALGSLNA